MVCGVWDNDDGICWTALVVLSCLVDGPASRKLDSSIYVYVE